MTVVEVPPNQKTSMLAHVQIASTIIGCYFNKPYVLHKRVGISTLLEAAASNAVRCPPSAVVRRTHAGWQRTVLKIHNLSGVNGCVVTIVIQ